MLGIKICKILDSQRAKSPLCFVTQFILKRELEANKNLNSNRFFINELMYAIVLISFIALVRY